jgi:hypothetical protein
MSNFEMVLEDLEQEYPKLRTKNFVSSNYGRPMTIVKKDGNEHKNVFFRWEHQELLQSQKLTFNINNNLFSLDFSDIKSISWD